MRKKPRSPYCDPPRWWIAHDLITAAQHGTPELVIAIHGYSTEQTNVRGWYKRIFQYVNQAVDQEESPFQGKRNLVFLGYRWSSEQPEIKAWSLAAALKALPIVLKVVPFLPIGLLLMATSMVLALKWTGLIPVFVAAFILATVAVASMIFSLVVLRIIVYFRDNYRANNFAVPDLVELIRQLDKSLQTELIKVCRNNPESARQFKVNLNFVAHSMGAFVATNAIRILADVFDPVATEPKPISQIGNTFYLKRLVLVSPDISTLAIENSRANFLSSSLRRFDEAYLFSNEGDLALQLASTAANYFSFPANTRKSGYRLGNITIDPTKHTQYGIVNLKTLTATVQDCAQDNQSWFETLATSEPGPALNSLFASYQRQSTAIGSGCEKLTIADLFTYFDCTDYIEVVQYLEDLSPNAQVKRFLQENPRYNQFIKRFKINGSGVKALGILSQAKGANRSRPKALSFLDYTCLIIDFVRGRDVHGGYFAAPFTQKMIYQLAFIGLNDVIKSCDSDPSIAFAQLDRDCQQYGLQVLLSPLHYKAVSCPAETLEEIKQALLEYIKLSE